MQYPPAILVMVVGVVWLLARRNRSAASAQPVLARQISVFGSLAVLVPFLVVFFLPVLYLAERLVPGLRIPSAEPFSYVWWNYPLPVAAAIVTMVVALVSLRRTVSTPEVPVVPIAPRGWRTFTSRRELTAAIVSAAVLIATSVIAGLASVTDESGLHTLIEMPGPTLETGESHGVATFYGWAYSVPVMLGVLVLSLLAWQALRASALPAFRRPDTVETESIERRQIASAIVRLYTAAVLLPLGGAFIQIGGAGMGSTGIGIPGVGDFMWSLGYASFAPAIQTFGYLIQIYGMFILVRAILAPRTRAVVLEPAVL